MSGVTGPPILQPISYYLGLVTSYHAARPNFMAVVQSLVAPAQALAAFSDSLPTIFDLDTAVGVQLDQTGEWIGVSRNVDVPLSGVYFSWGVPGLGWGQGNWKGAFDPSQGITTLGDGDYRTLLKAKVAANYWNGTNAALPAVVNTLFPDIGSATTNVVVTDNMNMSMTVGVSGTIPSQVQLALLDSGSVPVKPASVAINYYVTSVDTAPLFAWGVQNSSLAGWGTGAWGLSPSALSSVLQPVVNVVQTGATIAGQATLTVNATAVPAKTGALYVVGAATVTVTTKVITNARATIPGTASVSATGSGTQVWSGAATIAGAANVNVNAVGIGYYATAAIGGTASVSVTATVLSQATARIAGVGSVSVGTLNTATTWSPTDNTGMALSNNNLTATG